MSSHRIAAIPADGIGPEVIGAGLRVLDTLQRIDPDLHLDVRHFDWGSEYYRKHGVMMPPDGLDTLRAFDAIYFGAVGDREIPDHVTLWGLRLVICQGFDQYANVRPTRILRGLESPLRACGPADLDWVIVRENSEGEYAGMGGRAHRGHAIEVGTEVAVFTRVGVERIMRFAFDLARSRPRKQLTVVTKSNAQRHGMVLWDDVAAEVAREYPDVTVDRELVDAMTARMVMKPRTLDVVVATNLHADILSDLAAALAGSLGIAPTANLDPSRRFPSMFEPIHGSAFDITGKGIANPIGSFWTAAMMLDHLGEHGNAARLMEAIERVTAEGIRSPDLGGTARTDEVTDAVCEALTASVPVSSSSSR
jgi:tartrate dehydrogenase/decarboxylase / D-malate dehydrogenase